MPQAIPEGSQDASIIVKRKDENTIEITTPAVPEKIETISYDEFVAPLEKQISELKEVVNNLIYQRNEFDGKISIFQKQIAEIQSQIDTAGPAPKIDPIIAENSDPGNVTINSIETP